MVTTWFGIIQILKEEFDINLKEKHAKYVFVKDCYVFGQKFMQFESIRRASNSVWRLYSFDSLLPIIKQVMRAFIFFSTNFLVEKILNKLFFIFGG